MNFTLTNLTAPQLTQTTTLTVQDVIRTYCNHYTRYMLFISIVVLVGSFLIGYYREDLEKKSWGTYVNFAFDILVVCFALFNILVALLP